MANNNKTYQQWWTATSDKVYQLLAHGRWFSPGTPASSTTKTGRHDIAEMLSSSFILPNLAILTTNDKQTTAPFILTELNLAKII
jgi:hypothetical protein